MQRTLLYGQFRKQFEEIFSGLSMQRETRVVKNYHMPDHVHMLLQNFWTRGDVVFTVGESSNRFQLLLEIECPFQYRLIIPKEKMKSQGLFFKLVEHKTYVVTIWYRSRYLRRGGCRQIFDYQLNVQGWQARGGIVNFGHFFEAGL